MSFRQAHTPEWLTYFRAAGFPDVRPLGAGVEGAIYRLGDGRVAKVWASRTAAELGRMQRFYADVARAELSFATPEIFDVTEIDGSVVTYERELAGVPLQKRLGFEDPGAQPEAASCVVRVLEELARVDATRSMQALPVLAETAPLWAEADTFGSAMAQLVGRRMARFAPVLGTQVDDLDAIVAATVQWLRALPTHPLSVIHGDLFPENILVDDTMRPTAVLDFGFLSTAGDPRLDAAIAAVTFNMYGPHAREITAEVSDLVVHRLGYPPEVLLRYRAVYALVTSNVFTPDGNDGHFPWCVAILNDREVRAALTS